jgi:hypothetical protein
MCCSGISMAVNNLGRPRIGGVRWVSMVSEGMTNPLFAVPLGPLTRSGLSVDEDEYPKASCSV